MFKKISNYSLSIIISIILIIDFIRLGLLEDKVKSLLLEYSEYYDELSTTLTKYDMTIDNLTVTYLGLIILLLSIILCNMIKK